VGRGGGNGGVFAGVARLPRLPPPHAQQLHQALLLLQLEALLLIGDLAVRHADLPVGRVDETGQPKELIIIPHQNKA